MRTITSPLHAVVFAVTMFAATAAFADETSATNEFDHAQWATVLSQFTIDGNIDYRRLAREPDALSRYLEQLEAIKRDDFATWSRDARMALWINAYNAYTVRWILDHYPTEGILETVPIWRRALGAPFSNRFIPLAELAAAQSGDAAAQPNISLSAIEHEILRKKFSEPRIHFAIVCASKSCPKLRDRPYTSAGLDLELDENARDFLRDPAKNRYDPGHNRLIVSKIFRWFDEDFEPGGGALGFYRRYGPESTVSALAASSAPASVEYGDYDWSLNGK